MNACVLFYRRLTRRKQINDEELDKSELVRCLTTLDLTALGVGSTLGAGAYVIAGAVAKSEAGPAVVVSFLVAAIASILAGLCYSEFGARVPKAGSAYVYTYVTVGEIMAFVIGWNLILEYVIGAASVARTASGYVDNLIGDVLVPWFNETMPMNVPTLTPYFDLLSLGITLLLTVILSVGVRESVTFTKMFTAVNLCILAYVIIAGAFQDDPANWSLDASMVPNGTGICREKGDCGVGGFMPYGIAGVTKGAATCFFAFVGFDGIAAAGEEAINPQKSIPIATIVSLGIVFVIYFAISLTITMMSPYYQLDDKAPFASVFEAAGWTVSKYIVSIGAMCALSVSLLCVMFPMPRIAFAMSQDGLIFKIFSSVSSRFKTPVFATIVTGLIAALMAALFETKALVEMMSIGTLLAYTLVSASVLLLRYEVFDEDRKFLKEGRSTMTPSINGNGNSKRLSKLDESMHLGNLVTGNCYRINETSKNVFARVLNPTTTCPTPFSATAVKALTGILSFWLITMCAVAYFGAKHIFIKPSAWGLSLLSISVLMTLVTLYLIDKQPKSLRQLTFTVPFVPYFPAASMLFNIFLMINLDPLTWIRFLIWMALGFSMYFGYGMWHSKEERQLAVKGDGHKAPIDKINPDLALGQMEKFDGP